MKFDIKRIGDICQKVCSGGTPTSSNPDYYDGGIPWLNTNEVNFCNIYSTNKTISEEGLNHSAAKYIPVNSIIVAMYGVTAGKCAVAKIPLTTNQACCNLVIDEEKAHYQYVYHFLKLQSDNLNKLANGGAQQNLNSIIIKKFKIALPSLNIQQRIASILSAYDNLIENNNKRIRLLEQMAENLYKEWFVRFRFPGHEKAEFENGLPKGWSLKNLFDVADVSYGYAFKSDLFCNDKNLNAVVRIRDIQDNHTDTYTSEVCDDKYLIEENAILVGMDGLFHMCLWNGEKAYLNQRVVKICSKKKDMCNYMIFMAIRPQIKFWEQVIAGTTVAHLGDKHLKKIKIAVPTENLLLKANESIQRIMVEKNQLFKQNQILSRQRDLLLPRLMSGKLEVKL